jgi:diguanylate cyclase (GGDEF)-like protein
MWVTDTLSQSTVRRLDAALAGLCAASPISAAALAVFSLGQACVVGAAGYAEFAAETIESMLLRVLDDQPVDPVVVIPADVPDFRFSSDDAPFALAYPIYARHLLCGAVLLEARPDTDADTLVRAIRDAETFWSEFLNEIGLCWQLAECELRLAEANRDLEATRGAVERLTEAVEQADRDKERFVANVNYELRAPLTAILGYCEVLQDTAYGSFNSTQADFLQQIETGGQDLLRVVDDLLSLSRLERSNEPLDVREFDIGRLFESIEATFAPVANRRGVKLMVTPDPACELIVGDEERLREALTHLLDNAFKFTSAGGTVWLTGEVVYASGSVQNLEIAVQDTGASVAAEQRQRVYQALTQSGTAAVATPGLDVGLAIANRVISLHGSRVSLESESETGCRVSFLMPHRHSAQARFRPMVAILESSSEISELLKLVLEGEGIEVVVPMVADASIEQLYATQLEGAAWRLPDVIVLDAALPRGDGFELCRIIKQRETTRHIPVVMLTVSPETTEKLRGLEVGATDVLTKPVNRKELVARVKALVSQKREFETMLKAYNSARHRAITDGLTGLFNHGYFVEKLTRQAEVVRRDGQPMSVILFDVDRFKHYNDTNGHEAGNGLLKELARVMGRCFRRSDFLARYGGEEFVILLPNTPKNQAAVLAERLRKRVAEHPFAGRETQPGGKLTVSLGVAAMPADVNDPKDLLELADRALYRAKESGRNRVCVVETGEDGKPKNSGYWKVSG